jgi:hypothetical protein
MKVLRKRVKCLHPDVESWHLASGTQTFLRQKLILLLRDECTELSATVLWANAMRAMASPKLPALIR